MARGGGLPIPGGQRLTTAVSGTLAWGQLGEGPVNPAPVAVGDRLHQLWITPHGLIKAALKYNATVQAQAEGGKKTTTISFTVPGQFKVKALVNEKNLAMPPPRAKALMALFNLKYPIFEAPHGSATSPELAIAVSNAGAMGALTLSRRPADATRTVVSQVRAGTKGPFLVNYILNWEPATLEIALDAGAPVVHFSWGMPTKQMVSAIRAAGAKFGMQVTSAACARAALDLGADYLACQGTEAGGHVQANRGLYEALPDVLKEARDTPVLACGGIGDGEGIQKALVADASGAMLGTRFVATIEANAHPAYQRALMEAHANDTVLTTCFQDGWPNAPHRALRN